MAVSKSDVEVIQMITEHPSTDIGIPINNQLGDMPLHHAIRTSLCGCASIAYDLYECPRVTVVKALLRAGVSVDQRNRDGDTALHLAVDTPWQCRNSIITLLCAGARPDILDRLGEPPYGMALRHQTTDVVRMLLTALSNRVFGMCTREVELLREVEELDD
ncbi:ankyrin repeat-containing domain protein [Tricharina praecox]|uniref:ankyrin repeat-containing domain protein n=1 Tax=Tricharina praecox TaxID=43433 RepID=UPI0022206D69|nr:ankyrin repeat-containing domain protein [Tricharina praecox]KAI5853771.1 ankyrin repeat-containing domain protein [Tricharina praecox]